MNFCPNCGSSSVQLEVPEGDHRLRHVCQNCQTIHYNNPLVVVACLITYNNKILLAKRGIEPRKDFWNLPGGFLENDETAEEGALREVLEETGLTITIDRLHTVFSVVKANQVFLIFKAEAPDDNYTLTPESTEIEFFEYDAIPWDEIAFSSNAYALRQFIANPQSERVHLGSHIQHP